jgi:uncharacterized membrane protein YuzA (DUF378 family)
MKPIHNDRKDYDMTGIDIAAKVLAGIGAINWGLVALAEFDLVAALFGMEFGETNPVTRIVYGLVGLAGVWVIARLFTREERRIGATARPQTSS